MNKIHVIIVAAGSGRRFGSPLPKQFCMLAGKPVLAHTLDNLRMAFGPEAEFTLVLHRDYFGLWEKLAAESVCARENRLVAGGASRAESVANALQACSPDKGEPVMVHDGVRPFVTPGMVKDLVKALDNGADYALPAVPLSDSIRAQETDGTWHARERSRYRAVQTPQAFRGGILVEAYRLANEKYGYDMFTDDASVVEKTLPGLQLRLTEGSPYNMKITNPLDLRIAEVLLD